MMFEYAFGVLKSSLFSGVWVVPRQEPILFVKLEWTMQCCETWVGVVLKVQVWGALYVETVKFLSSMREECFASPFPLHWNRGNATSLLWKIFIFFVQFVSFNSYLHLIAGSSLWSILFNFETEQTYVKFRNCSSNCDFAKICPKGGQGDQVKESASHHFLKFWRKCYIFRWPR